MTNEWTVNNMKGVTVFNKNHVDTKKQPMFFGQPLGMQRYDEFKYPVFDKLTYYGKSLSTPNKLCSAQTKIAPPPTC